MSEVTGHDVDAENVRAAIALVRERVPGAAFLSLETSDQNRGYGFTFCGVSDVSGREIVLPADLDSTIESEVYDVLCDVDWNGAVGEDRHGYAVLAL